MHKRCSGGERGRHVDDGGQRLVLDLDGLDGVRGPIGAVGDHDGHRVTEIPHFLGGDRQVIGDDEVVADVPRGGQRAVVRG
jgi:hypothetical protein